MRRLLAIAALTALAVTALAQAEVTQRGGVRVTFEGKIAPKKLPRHGTAPVAVSVGGTIASV
jgi:hypothetical protein